MKACGDCAGGYQAIRTLRSTVSDTAPRFEPPANFEGRLRSALRREGEPNARPRIVRWRWIVAGVSLIVAHGYVGDCGDLRDNRRDVLAQRIVSSHAFAMANHLTDVMSSDRHTVKPGRRQVRLLAASERFESAGWSEWWATRYIGNRPWLRWFYQRGQHAINLFVWPSSEAPTVKTSISNGYNLIGWNRKNENWVVSDLNCELQLLRTKSNALKRAFARSNRKFGADKTTSFRLWLVRVVFHHHCYSVSHSGTTVLVFNSMAAYEPSRNAGSTRLGCWTSKIDTSPECGNAIATECE